MLGHGTPGWPGDIADDPVAVTNWLEKYPRTAGRARRASIHLCASPGASGNEGYGTRLSLIARHDRELKAIIVTVSLDEHRPASPETNGMESTRFKIGRGAKAVHRGRCDRYSARQLEAAYDAAIAVLRAQPEILTDLARSYES